MAFGGKYKDSGSHGFVTGKGNFLVRRPKGRGGSALEYGTKNREREPVVLRYPAYRDQMIAEEHIETSLEHSKTRCESQSSS